MMEMSVAQNVNDVNRFLTTELNGSARYTSMAGAFGALGGDLTALSFNPASSSVFLNSEFGASVNYKINSQKELTLELQQIEKMMTLV